MGVSSSSAALAAICLLLYCVHLYIERIVAGHLPLPPGPRAIPILGNVHQLPRDHQYKTFQEWSRIYGDITRLYLFRKPALVLSSAQAIHDLLDKKNAVYSDRPQFVLVDEIVGWNRNLAIMPYGDTWRMHRKWFQNAFLARNSLNGYRHLQQREAYNLLIRLLEAPDAFLAHIKSYAAALVIEIAYGHTATSLDDEFIRLAEDVMHGTSNIGGTAVAMVDVFPFLKHIPTWMPGAGFKRKALEVRALVDRMHNIPYQSVCRSLATGMAKPSFLASLIETGSKEAPLTPGMEQEVKGAAATLYVGKGSLTSTTTVLSQFVLAMVLHPHVLKKAQDEIDRIVGTTRLPVVEDREALPYLECVIQEVYRWRPPLPLGVQHQSTEDDEYRGYFIPRGTIIFPNIWWVLQYPTLFPEPEKFRPERYQEMDKRTSHFADPRWLTFGFGRRICPGRKLGDSSVWLVAANIIAAFDIRKARSHSGEEITPLGDFKPGPISHPEPFQCEIRPRSRQMADMILQLKANVSI
ncbi:cytochrome P450 [Wolfiporia cocos MD-104 SS10]|uniref:Cytochrome P450 n=1 Tax=Wolfiporia cocos (strain MD-104) TaxID=742152 RepID=A0A2H3J8X4_WOLCO|nr:cytochrome P450 [Wolfiporia cocos MD-104 SS10]